MFEAQSWLTEWLSKQDIYQNITHSDNLKKLLPIYLNEAEKREQNESINQGKIVKSLINKEDLCSKATIFHEMVEIEVYLAIGFTPEEVADWTAHDKAYERAHNIAETHHLNLIKDAFKEYSGANLPLEIILMTQPSAQSIDPELDFLSHRILKYATQLSNWPIHEGKYEDIAFDATHIQEAIKLYTKFGGVYTDAHFEEKVLQKITKIYKQENQRNKIYSERAFQRKFQTNVAVDTFYFNP